VQDPIHGIVASYTADGIPDALVQGYNAGQGNYNMVMTLVTPVFLCGPLRTNMLFVIGLFTPIFVFSFFAARSYQLGYNPTAESVAHAVYYFKIAGGLGLVTMIMGWYLVRFPN
jgi:hypothetical protein